LYKEWKSYSERYENDENKAISWEKKESKSISQGNYYSLFIFISFFKPIYSINKCMEKYVWLTFNSIILLGYKTFKVN
jgi:hypothetical protein